MSMAIGYVYVAECIEMQVQFPCTAGIDQLYTIEASIHSACLFVQAQLQNVLRLNVAIVLMVIPSN